MKKWKTLSSEDVFNAGFFKLRVDSCELPDGRVMPKYYVADFPAWIHVIAVTRDKQLVMVRQFRYGAGEESLEVPGGSFDPRLKETPKDAGARELKEETGYASQKWRQIAEFYPNPAFQSNKMYTFLATDCELVAEPELDPFEDLTTELMPIGEALKGIESGVFNHGLVMSSLAIARPYLLDLIS